MKKFFNKSGNEVFIPDINKKIPDRNYITISDMEYDKSKDLKDVEKMGILQEIKNFIIRPFKTPAAVESPKITLSIVELEKLIRNVVSEEVSKIQVNINTSASTKKTEEHNNYKTSVKKIKSKEDELVFIRPDTEDMQGDLKVSGKIANSSIADVVQKLKNLS